MAESVIKMSDFDKVITREITKSDLSNIEAGGSATISIDASYNGYTALGIVGVKGSGTSDFVLSEFYCTNNTVSIFIKNTKSVAGKPNSVTAKVLYKRN